MSARLLAFVCISQIGLCGHVADRVSPQRHPLVVFLKGSDVQNPSALAVAKQELRKLMQPAGFEIEFRTRLEGESVSGTLVVMTFDGLCGENTDSNQAADLATTAVANGRVQPFTKVHCGTISKILAPPLAGMPGLLRETMLGRAIARVMAHELYHVLANETRHADEGIAKTSFSADDLLAVQMRFDDIALDRFASRDGAILSEE